MNTNRLVLVFVLAFAAGAAYYFFRAASDAWQPPLVVQIQSEKDVAALTPTWGIWHSGAEKGESQGLLLRDGDFFFSEDDVPIRYRASDGQSIRVMVNNWSAQVGDKTVTVLLDKEGGSGWLGNAADRQLAEIRTVGLPSEIDAATLAGLKRLAAVNPNVDLSAESEAALLQALPLFKPRAVFVPESEGASSDVFEALANQPRIEMLSIGASAPGSLDFLPTLPGLSRLLIGEWDVEKAGPLPAGLSGLKSLLVLDLSNVKDLKALAAAPVGLEELSLIGLNSDGLTDLAGIEKMTNLRTLVLWGDKLGNLSSLAGLTQLRWVGLPPNTSQAQFAAFVSAHPNLAILDMMGNETVTDLSPLSALKDLQGLVLDGPYDSLNVVTGLTSLRFVGISNKTWEAKPEQVAAIRKALPDALVVRVSPLCLGSGWILLFVPVLAVMWILRRQSRRAGQPA